MGIAICQVPKPSGAVISCHRQLQCSPHNAHGVKAEKFGPSRRHSRVCHLHRGMPAVGPFLFLLGDSAEDTAFAVRDISDALTEVGGRQGELGTGPGHGVPSLVDPAGRSAESLCVSATNNTRRLHPPPSSHACTRYQRRMFAHLEPTLNSETVESPLLRCTRQALGVVTCHIMQIGPEIALPP